MIHNFMLRLSLVGSIALLVLTGCSKDVTENQNSENYLLAAFEKETGFHAYFTEDTTLIHKVTSWQGSGDYPGVDDWVAAKVTNEFLLYGGLPGQSEYYTVVNTLIDADTNTVSYWESLQVKENPTFGYRPMVGVFDFSDTLVVALARTLANPQYGDGGAWQIFVEDYGMELRVLDTVYLKPE